jgi:hypothetical protein
VSLRESTSGPDQYWSETLPPSAGQYETIAVLALELLEVDRPEHRLAASIAITRLRAALQGEDRPPALPRVEAF